MLSLPENPDHNHAAHGTLFSPQVVQLLERAFSKGLKSVFLGDAEPLLSNFSVNITSLRQLCDSSGEYITALPFSNCGSGL